MDTLAELPGHPRPIGVDSRVCGLPGARVRGFGVHALSIQGSVTDVSTLDSSDASYQ